MFCSYKTCKFNMRGNYHYIEIVPQFVWVNFINVLSNGVFHLDIVCFSIYKYQFVLVVKKQTIYYLGSLNF